MPWIAILGPAVTAIVTFLVTWGSTKEKLSSMRHELDAVQDQVVLIGRLDTLATDLKSAVRRLHERIDGLELMIHAMSRSVAVLDERSGHTPVHGTPIYNPPRKPRQEETSEPPKTRIKNFPLKKDE